MLRLPVLRSRRSSASACPSREHNRGPVIGNPYFLPQRRELSSGQLPRQAQRLTSDERAETERKRTNTFATRSSSKDEDDDNDARGNTPTWMRMSQKVERLIIWKAT